MNAAHVTKRTLSPVVVIAETDRAKHAGGRPTDYDPAYCNMVVEQMRAGYSLSAFAGLIGVSRPTINNWMSQHEEFFEAVSRAKAARLLLWERHALAIAQNGGGQGAATMVIFALKNMGGEEWREKQEIAHSGTISLGDLVAASYKKDDA